MSKYTLTYKNAKSQETYIEEVVKSGEHVPYFEQEYKDARKLIKEIVDLQGTSKDKEDERNNKKEKIKKYGCNNRILFTGQRGCGKTSVMRSLADYLSKSNPKPTLVDKDGNEVPTDFMFCCLPMVDPSHFDNNNNILLTVITSMFSEAKKKMNKDKDGGDTDKREGLLKQFEKVFKSLDSIKSELTSYTLESLNRKSDAEDLKDKMKDLVDKYLIFQGCGDESRLVLLIDDIDMSVSYAPEMLEQLRKYLELDNLIILMSANLGQLSNEMREKYSSAFQYTLKDSNQALSIDVEDLATKYLLKLFPTSRRINVERHVDQLLKTDLFVEGWNEKKERNNNTASEDKGNFQKVILSLIWSKTRLLFIPKDPENTLHPIIPTNLRDLAQFLDMLTSLKKVEPRNNNLFKEFGAYEECQKNLQVFKRYVMNTWIPNHLSVEEELVFKNIPTDITEINKHLINAINVRGTNHKTRLMSREVSLDMIERNAEDINIDRDIYTMVSPNDPKFVKANKISDIFNQPSNYSYGDLLLMIDKYETYFESEEDRRFTDAIKIYYTILLFETMFFKSKDVKYTKARFDKDKNEGKDMVIPIQKLIGGTVYYPNYFEIITSKHFKQKGPSYDAKRAFYHKIAVETTKKTKSGKIKKLESPDIKKQVGKNYPLFSVLYYGDIRPDRYETRHIYDTEFDNDSDVDDKKYVTFDILSILNNMLNPCHTISRMGNDYESTVNLESWASENELKDKSNTDFYLPNALLPFYSVDIMLQYLKYSVSVDNSIGELKNMQEQDLNKEGKDSYTLLSKKERDGLKSLLDNITDNSKISEKEFLKKKKDSNGIETKFVDFNILNTISEGNRTILTETRKVFDKVYSLDYSNLHERFSIMDSFKDYIMALVLKHYEGSTRERELLLKNLHKYNTCSEIFKYLFSVLCKDDYRENSVRMSVQNAVHSYEFVHFYYNKLWNYTARMLENVNVSMANDESGVKPDTIYKGIYEKAIACFVMEPQTRVG